MEAALENAERFADVLAVARSPWASDWDEVAVSRAFQWARYFEHLNAQLAGSAGAQAAWRRRLRSRRADLRLEELGRGQEVLSQALLLNPAASVAAFHRAAAAWRRGAGRSCEAALSSSLGSAVRRAAAVRVLRACGQSATGPGAEPPEQRAAVATQAAILCQRLGEQRQDLPEQEVLRRALTAGGWEPIAELLAGAAAPPPALQWLLGNASAACRELPCAVLTELAARQPAFARAYSNYLLQWAGGMRFDAGSGQWIHEEAPEQNWERLLQHFASLLQGPPKIKESTQETLNSLKTTDGNFEVWGISVWTDLLLALTR
ncbi:Fanconi anemia group F protein-like [Narcine bancroftii]|uniref:Fanconi anemia group F protein-like n=1 Tax=Narcine bancroftii TaxID=1343680 RepID=UPI003831F6DB